MKRLICCLVLVIAFTAALAADVTIKQSGSGKGFIFSSKMDTITYIKGSKMRMDTVDGTTIKSMVFDVDAQKIYMFDNKKKEADVYDMALLGEEIQKSVSVDGAKVKMTPNGKTKQIAGRDTTGYDIELTMPVKMGGEKGMAMNLLMTGDTYIAKGAPGSADFSAFYKVAAEKGFIFGDPRAAKGSPGPAKAIAEVHEEFAKLGGVPYESNMQMKGDGDGMAGLMAKVLNISSSSTVTSVETGTLAAEMFAPPAGYKLNVRK